MKLTRFRAENFRNIDFCDIGFSDGINILYGRNAQGKTNAVEGIYLFSRGKSFRAGEDRELVKFGAQGFRVSVEYEDKDGGGSLEYALFGRERRRLKNGYKINKVTEMVGNLRTVLFYPDDLGLVKGGPEERRAFLNVAVSQCYPAYIKCYGDYKSSLDQRNALLKMISKGEYVSDTELDSWSFTMAKYAAEIYCMRNDYVERLKVYAREVMGEISGGVEDLNIFYKSNIDDSGRKLERSEVEKLYSQILTSNKEKEKILGVSLYGPHRDDLEIEINGKSARLFASQGQQRCVVLSLKISEGEVNREIWGDYPVYLFDDVLSELDEPRREYIMGKVKDKQIIITTCEWDEKLFSGASVFEVDGGKYVSSHR